MKAIELARKIVEQLEDNKGEDILLLDLQGQAPLGSYNVICSANSERGLSGLLAGVQDEMKKLEVPRPTLEGNSREGWLLADFGSVVLHLFSNPQREYYQLEDLWTEAKVLLHVQ